MANFDIGIDLSKKTEGDVEAQTVLPLLTDPHLLGIPKEWIKSKAQVHSETFGKGKNKKNKFIPDFLIIVNAIPVVAIEVKSPEETVSTAYKEATDYAHVLNRRFPSTINPCTIIIGCNGDEISIGYWDSDPKLTIKLKKITAGSKELESIRDLFSEGALKSFANGIIAQTRLKGFTRPSDEREGPSMLTSKIAPNSFTAPIEPILSEYFSSQPAEESNKIWTVGYISSNEITNYESSLEIFLKARIATAKRTDKILLKTSKKKERKLGSAISTFINNDKNKGVIRIITGSVGAGKSLFIRRFKECLQPKQVKAVTSWAFIDFNNTPPNINEIQVWACKQFLKSIVTEGTELDITDAKEQEQIFAERLHDRRAHYDNMNAAKPGSGNGDLERARDLEGWRQNETNATESVARYLQGDKNKTIVIVFDNVDKKGAEEQLQIFQLAMWMKELTKAFIIIQMRDVTFERYKSKPPLDTFKTGTVFHITPPRFVNVIKKRLDLSFRHLEKRLPDELEFNPSTGSKVKYPGRNAVKYLETIHEQIFLRQKNISPLMEALSDRNVRLSLDMFVSILNSGHMTEGELGENAISGKNFLVKDHILIRTLMRTDYVFYHETSGFVSNLFYCKNDWERPSNFHLIEVLYFLLHKNKSNYSQNLQDYLSFATISEELARKGIIKEDARKACLYALKKGLIEADSLLTLEILDTTCLKATSSAFIHMDFLSENIEYLSAILYSTPISDESLVETLSYEMQVENRFRLHHISKKVRLINMFHKYLKKQATDIRKLYIGIDAEEETGASYILGQIEKSTEHFNRANHSENRTRPTRSR